MASLLRNERLLISWGLIALGLAVAALIGLRVELAPLVAGALVGIVALLAIIRWPLVGVGLTAVLVLTGGLSQMLQGSLLQRLYVICLALTFLAYGHRLLADRELMRHWLRIRVADVIFAGLLATAGLSLIVAPFWYDGTDELEALLKGFVLYLLMSRAIRSEEELIFVAKFILVGAIWQATTGWTNSSAESGVARISGNLVSINAFGFALMRGFPWTLFFAFFGRGIWRWLGLLGTVLVSLTALATVSRTAAGTLAFVAIFWACFSTRGFDRRLRNLGLMLIVLVLGFSVYGDALLERWSLLRELTNTSNVEYVVDDDGGRDELRAAAMRIVAEHPIFGVGIGNTPYMIMQEMYRRKPFPVHMMYLQVAADIGLFGLLCFVALPVVGYLRAAALWLRMDNDRDRALIATCVSILATWSIYGFSGNWHYINFAYLLVAFVHLLPEIMGQRKPAAEGQSMVTQ